MSIENLIIVVFCLVYRSSLKNWFLSASALQQIFCLHLRFVLEQSCSLQTQKFAQPPGQIPNFSMAPGIDDQLKKLLNGKKVRQRGFRPNLADSEVITMEIVGAFQVERVYLPAFFSSKGDITTLPLHSPRDSCNPITEGVSWLAEKGESDEADFFLGVILLTEFVCRYLFGQIFFLHAATGSAQWQFSRG